MEHVSWFCFEKQLPFKVSSSLSPVLHVSSSLVSQAVKTLTGRHTRARKLPSQPLDRSQALQNCSDLCKPIKMWDSLRWSGTPGPFVVIETTLCRCIQGNMRADENEQKWRRLSAFTALDSLFFLSSEGVYEVKQEEMTFIFFILLFFDKIQIKSGLAFKHDFCSQFWPIEYRWWLNRTLVVTRTCRTSCRAEGLHDYFHDDIVAASSLRNCPSRCEKRDRFHSDESRMIRFQCRVTTWTSCSLFPVVPLCVIQMHKVSSGVVGRLSFRVSEQHATVPDCASYPEGLCGLNVGNKILLGYKQETGAGPCRFIKPLCIWMRHERPWQIVNVTRLNFGPFYGANRLKWPNDLFLGFQLKFTALFAGPADWSCPAPDSWELKVHSGCVRSRLHKARVHCRQENFSVV